jgi:hypothetical protein
LKPLLINNASPVRVGEGVTATTDGEIAYETNIEI